MENGEGTERRVLEFGCQILNFSNFRSIIMAVPHVIIYAIILKKDLDFFHFHLHVTSHFILDLSVTSPISLPDPSRRHPTGKLVPIDTKH
jgi:hypothetical protein